MFDIPLPAIPGEFYTDITGDIPRKGVRRSIECLQHARRDVSDICRRASHMLSADADDLLRIMVINLTIGRRMALAFNMAADQIDVDTGIMAERRLEAITILREIFEAEFRTDIKATSLLEKMLISGPSVPSYGSDVISLLDRAASGAMGGVLKICASTFLNGIPGYNHSDKELIAHSAKYKEQIGLLIQPLKLALTRIVIAEERAADRARVKDLAHQLNRLAPEANPETISETYELLSRACGCPDWNHLSARLSSRKAA